MTVASGLIDAMIQWVLALAQVDFQYEWEPQPNRFHTQWVNVPEYWLDTTPVTHAAFADYLSKNPSAIPEDKYHYLKNWCAALHSHARCGCTVAGASPHQQWAICIYNG